MSKNIVWFKEVGKDDGATVGGKGANLGELTSVGLPVPPGYIITADAYFDYIKSTGLEQSISSVIEGFDKEDTKDLQERAEKSKKLILETPLPDSLKQEILEGYHKLAEESGTLLEELYVAVRSSATAEDLAGASFAGQQATYLNVIGDDDLLVAVLKCWASLFEARAIYYRAEQGFGQLEVGIAVPVQKMVNSEAAGVMFTIDPSNNDLDHISIEAAYGLGEVVVLGAVTPDRYLVDKKTLEISSKEIFKQEWKLTRDSGSGDTGDLSVLKSESIPVPVELQDVQKITDEQILELAKLALKIEEHYGKPQDTEWALEEGKMYMVQSRPVTTLGDSTKDDSKAVKPDEGKHEIIMKGQAASTGMASGPVKIIHSPTEIDLIKEGDVLVTEMTTPDFVPAMKRAAGIVTDAGGRTCHAAIVSRELGIPCVVGTGEATTKLKDGQIVTVDGKGGNVYDGKIEVKQPEIATGTVVAGQTAPITATKIYVNLAEPSLAEKVAAMDVDGVGLLRAEFIIMESIAEHPKKMIKEGRQEEYVTKLAEGMETFAKAFHPRNVVYRATDFKTNEYRGLKGGEEFEPNEENPMIGYRGCFRYLKDPEEFGLELEAIKRVRKNYNNLQLMIPFVRRTDEFAKVKAIVEGSGLNKELDPDFKLWIMVEVPSAVIEIDKYCEMGIDGVSIGSNDLTQLTLGLDRDSSVVAEEFDERYPAVQWMIKHTVETCAKYGVTCSICGQAPSVYPEVAQQMVEYGATSISVNPDMIDSTRKLVAAVEEKIVLSEIVNMKNEIKDLESRLSSDGS
ncbi:MAG: phosphoenolpyruvate synthase [bacterium]